MRILFAADRWSVRGGADVHLAQVVAWARSNFDRVELAVGRVERGAAVPRGLAVHTIRGLASAVAASASLEAFERLVSSFDLIHVHNVMNPAALELAVSTGRALVTIQDHRVLCPAMGKTLPDGAACREPMDRADCARCLPDAVYRERTLKLTTARRDALRGASLIALSTYMADELAAVGLDGATVIPPWFETGEPRSTAGDAFILGGRLVRHKAPDLAWRAWRRAGRPLPLRILGEGPLAADLEGAERLGWLAHKDCLAELACARALLFPAWWQEPFGMLAVEALSRGTPVVAAAGGGSGEWSDAGCLCPPRGDEAAFAAAIEELAEDPEAARRLGEAGRRMVAERFNRGKIEPRLAAAYAQVGS